MNDSAQVQVEESPPSPARTGPGGRLQAARLERNLDVSAVALALHVAPRIIEAIEQDRYEVFDAPVYARGFLRAYARLLNLPTEPVLADYEALAGDAPAPTLIPPANAGPLPRDWAGLQKAGLLVLALGLVVASYWWWMGRVAPPESSVAAVAPNVASTVLPADSAAGDADGAAIVPPLGDAMMLGDAADGSPAPVAGRNELPAAVASAATRAATPPAAKPPATATTPAAPAAVTVAAGATPLAAKPANTTASPPIAAPVAGATKAPAPLPAPSSVATAPQAARVPLTSGQAPPPLIAPVVDGPQIVLRGKKDCWVEVRAAGGARLFYGLVRPGETHTMPGPAPWFVYLGFADGIEVSVGGHVVDVPAARREGVKARFGVSADGTPR